MGGSVINGADATRLRDCHLAILQTSWPNSELTTALAMLDELNDVIGARIVVITIGAEGAIYDNRSRKVWLKSHDIWPGRLHGAGAAISAGMPLDFLRTWNRPPYATSHGPCSASLCNHKRFELPRSTIDAWMRELGETYETSLGNN